MLKIDQRQAQEIIEKFVQGQSVSQISRVYHICGGTVSAILHGTIWKECKRPADIQSHIDQRRNKLNQQQAQQIIDDFVGGKGSLELAREFNVSLANISCIVRGETWKQCQRPQGLATDRNIKVTQQQAQEIIDKFVRGVGTTQLAAEYGIWTTTVGNILRGHNWKECQRPSNIQDLLDIQQKLRSGKHYKDLPSLVDRQMDVLIGSLLGDGTVAKLTSDRSNGRFSKLQVLDRKPYLDWHFQIMEGYSSKVCPVFSEEKLIQVRGKIKRLKTPRHLSAYRFETFNHPIFTELRKQWYPNGVKRVPLDLELNPQRIAVWYFDDGSNNEKQRYAIIATHGFSFEEVNMLAEKLHAFNMFPKVIFQRSQYTGKKQPLLKFSRSSYDNLISMVKPFMLWDCFAYKIEWHHCQKQWEYGKLTKEQAQQIINLRKTQSAREIAEQMNVHVNTIYAIVSGRSWGHLQAT